MTPEIILAAVSWSPFGCCKQWRIVSMNYCPWFWIREIVRPFISLLSSSGFKCCSIILENIIAEILSFSILFYSPALRIVFIYMNHFEKLFKSLKYWGIFVCIIQKKPWRIIEISLDVYGLKLVKLCSIRDSNLGKYIETNWSTLANYC